MKAVTSVAFTLAFAGLAHSAVAQGGKATLQDILFATAGFGPPSAGAATVGLHNERDGRLVLTHQASFGVRSLVHEPGTVQGDGSVRVSLPAAGPPDRSFFDVFNDIPQGTNTHLFRFFGDLSAAPGEPALIGLLLPAVQKVRQAAARAKTSVPMGVLFLNLTWDIELLAPGATIDDVGIVPSADSFFDIFLRVNFEGAAPGRGLADQPLVRVTFTGEESSVPAPGAAALLAGAGVLAARRRRR